MQACEYIRSIVSRLRLIHCFTEVALHNLLARQEYTTYWLVRNCDLPLLMSWRRVLPEELFAHHYSPNAGIGRGYAVDSQFFLDGHENCECHRAEEPDKVTWFLQHNDAEHGSYPVDSDTMIDSLIKQLHEQLPSLRNGFVVHVTETTSYGRILPCRRHVYDGQFYQWRRPTC
jgi:hypothetical protein